jgi:hypothetical protein
LVLALLVAAIGVITIFAIYYFITRMAAGA